MQTLSEYLAAKGQTQADFAAKVPTTTVTVWRWCAEKATPTPDHIRRINELTDGHVPPAVWFAARAAE